MAGTAAGKKNHNYSNPKRHANFRSSRSTEPTSQVSGGMGVCQSPPCMYYGKIEKAAKCASYYGKIEKAAKFAAVALAQTVEDCAFSAFTDDTCNRLERMDTWL